ncbi:MAG: DEAD/DEAH box helicase [Candidatus Kapaibacteriota bacterium]
MDSVKKIRDKLQHSWLPFFTRFGKPTEVQEKTIPKVLDNKNVVVASPTATGKTEAIVAPLAEKFKTEHWDGLAILYIVPTRALANDTLARIEGSLSDMEITTALKHGDKPYLSTKNLPNLLITTPESLDSLICRRPNIFKNLQSVVLDEIHILDNTYRGDQLRILLRRLKEIATNKYFSVHLLSATIVSPFQIATRYIDQLEKLEVVKIGKERPIKYHIINSLENLFHLSKKEGWKKLLWFCNYRESVEKLSLVLSNMWHPYPVVAHHGSLSRKIREEAEKVMKENKVAVCIATSTLEVGIDIGDIDVIVLAEIPWSISSLLQRIGRGNRRKGFINVVVKIETDEEKNLIEAMFNVASSGNLPMENYEPDLSVLVQQILSYLYQHRNGVSTDSLLRILGPLCEFNSDVELILNHLRKEGLIEYSARRWFASSRLNDMGEKGRIHSNIPDENKYNVIDINSGKKIGTIAGVFDQIFALAGRTWQVVSVDNNNINVKLFTGIATSALFKRHRDKGAFHFLLPRELRTNYYERE